MVEHPGAWILLAIVGAVATISVPTYIRGRLSLRRQR